MLLEAQATGVDREGRAVLHIGVSFVFLSQGPSQWQCFETILNQTLYFHHKSTWKNMRMSSSWKVNKKELTSASSHLNPPEHPDASKDSQAMVSCYQKPFSIGHELCPPENRVDLQLGVGVGC